MTTEQRKINARICGDYRNLVVGLIDRSFIGRVEEEEGRVVTAEEVKEHGQKCISPDGIVHFKWRDKLVLEFIPAGYDEHGDWRDAEIGEVRLRTIEVPE